MRKLGTIIFALFSVAVAVLTHLCVVCRYFAVLCRFFKAISLQCRNLAQQGLKKVAKTSVNVINGDAPNKGEKERIIGMKLYQHQHQMLYLHDHKGITVLQKLLV